MATQLLVASTVVADITVTGGYVREQMWTGMLGRRIEAPVPDMVAPTLPSVLGVVVPREVSVGFLLVGTTPAAFYSLLAAVQAVVETTATVVLTRRVDTLAGQVSKTARAVYLGGCDPTMRSHSVGAITPRWHLLDSDWA
jgi:hypothetical protein